jgi:hypothetical protein
MSSATRPGRVNYGAVILIKRVGSFGFVWRWGRGGRGTTSVYHRFWVRCGRDLILICSPIGTTRTVVVIKLMIRPAMGKNRRVRV